MTMWDWWRRRRRASARQSTVAPPPPGSLAHFQNQVIACVHELNRFVPPLADDFSPAALATSLSMQLEMVFALGLKHGYLMEGEVDALLRRIEGAKVRARQGDAMSGIDGAGGGGPAAE